MSIIHQHRSFNFFLTAATLCTALCSCSGSGRFITGVDEEVEVSRKGKLEWFGREWCPENLLCSQGTSTRASTLEVARTDAPADAIKQFGMSLECRAKSRFQAGRVERGLPEVGDSPDVDRVVDELLALAGRINIQKIKSGDFWWRKHRPTRTDEKYNYYYYYVLGTIPKATWNLKNKESIDKAKGQYLSTSSTAELLYIPVDAPPNKNIAVTPSLEMG